MPQHVDLPGPGLVRVPGSEDATGAGDPAAAATDFDGGRPAEVSPPPFARRVADKDDCPDVA
jgi:hypothetical protein